MVSAQSSDDVVSKEELKALAIAKEAIMSPKPPLEGAETASEKKVCFCFVCISFSLFSCLQERRSTWRKSQGVDKGFSKRRDSKGMGK